MGSDVSRTHYQALLVGDPRLRTPDALWSAQSSYSQAGPRPGVPVAEDASEMVLEAVGEQAAGSQLRIRAHRAGMPGPGGGFVWRNEADGTDEYRGWDPPSVATGWEAVEWTDGSVSYTIRSATRPHAITLDDGTVLVSAQTTTTAFTRVTIYKRNASTGAWTSQHIYSQGSPTFGLNPCLCPLPSGRVLCYYWLEDDGDDTNQVQMQYSDDATTWSVGAVSVLQEALDVSGSPGSGVAGGDPGKLRAAYYQGQVLLVAEYQFHDTDFSTLDVVIQWASSDLGCSFECLTTFDGTSECRGRFIDLIVLGGQFCLFHLTYATDFTSNIPAITRVASAFSPIDTADHVRVTTVAYGEWVTDSGSAPITLDDGDLAAYVDDDGSGYLLLRHVAGNNAICVLRSADGGDTWEFLGRSEIGFDAGMVYNIDDSSTYPTHMAATAQGGRGLLLHNWSANPGNEDNSLGCLYLGGYSTFTMPSRSATRTDVFQTTWDGTYLPFDEPGDVGWTPAGTGVETLVDGGLQITCTADTRFYDSAPVGTVASGIIFRISLDLTGVGALATGSNYIHVRALLADSIDDFDLSLRFQPDGAGNVDYKIWDDNGGAFLGTTQTIASELVDVIVAFRDEHLSTWHRARSMASDRAYEEGLVGEAATSDTATPAATNILRFGTSANLTATYTVFEFFWAVRDAALDSVSQDHGDGLDNPDDLFPHSFSNSPTYVDAGVKVRAIDGPCMVGETWDLDARYDYEISRIFPGVSPSPRIRWRSTSTAQQTIALAFDPTLLGTVEAELGNTAIGLFLNGINWRLGTLQGYDVDTAAWVTILAIDTSTGMTGLDFTRKSNTVVPATSGAGDQPFLHRHECAGWTIGYNGVVFRRLLGNSEGRWDRTVATTKRPTLFIDTEGEDTSADPTSGGSAYLMPTSYVGLVFTAATYAGYRLLISSQSCADSFFEIGSHLLGPVVIADPYDWGRIIEATGGTEVTKARDGTTKSTVLSPTSRTVTLAWQDGTDLSSVETADPDYVKVTSTAIAPAGTARATPYLLDGLLGQQDGPHRHVVYIPRFSKGTPDSVHLNRRAQFVYGRMTSPVTTQVVLGEEGESELVRVGSVTIEEDV